MKATILSLIAVSRELGVGDSGNGGLGGRQLPVNFRISLPCVAMVVALMPLTRDRSAFEKQGFASSAAVRCSNWPAGRETGAQPVLLFLFLPLNRLFLMV